MNFKGAAEMGHAQGIE